MDWPEIKKILLVTWDFIWNDNSIWSWIVNVLLAFVIIKFLVYPGLGLLFGTGFPIVAVVSGSMEHNSAERCVDYEQTSFLGYEYKKCKNYEYEMCGKKYSKGRYFSLDEYWSECGEWYGSNTKITLDNFNDFRFKNGFNKGDIMVLMGKKPQDINIGEIIVFQSKRPDPIIHRVVLKWSDASGYHFYTKGDHNKQSIKSSLLDETDIHESQLLGKAVLRIPYLGYVKIWFVELLQLLTF